MVHLSQRIQPLKISATVASVPLIGMALWHTSETGCDKMPVKGERLGDLHLLHQGKTDCIHIAEILVVVFSQDLSGLILQVWAGPDALDARRLLYGVQKPYRCSVAQRPSHVYIGLSYDEVCSD